MVLDVPRYPAIFSIFRETPRKHPTAITLLKIVPETSGWTQKTRLGIFYNLCAKSGAKLIYYELDIL